MMTNNFDVNNEDDNEDVLMCPTIPCSAGKLCPFAIKPSKRDDFIGVAKILIFSFFLQN